VLMCDGSVRYLKKGMSDAVFKAICTVDGPTPPDWKFDEDNPPIARPKVAEPPALKGKAIPPGPGTGGPGGPGGTVVAGGGKQPKGGGKKDPPGGNPAGWQQYTSQEGGFSVSMPAGAKETLIEAKGNGSQVTMKALGVECEDGKSGYLVGSARLTAELLKSSSDCMFSNAKTGVIQNMGAKVTSESPTTLGNDPGRELVLSVQGRPPTYVRIYLVQDRLYTLVAYGPDMSPSAREYAAFFGSFKLTDR